MGYTKTERCMDNTQGKPRNAFVPGKGTLLTLIVVAMFNVMGGAAVSPALPAMGDAFPQFLAQPWIDPATGKEYPPWTLDDERTIIHNAVPLLRSVKANPAINHGSRMN